MQYTCTNCKAEKASVKFPAGWKTLPTGVVCKQCKKSSGYRIRAFDLPVIGVADGDVKEFRKEARQVLRRSAVVFNRALQAHYAADDLPMPSEKVPSAPKVSSYAKIKTGKNLGVVAGAVASICRASSMLYSKGRFAILRGQQSLPLRRLDRGVLPLPRQAWENRFGVVDLPIQTSEEKRAARQSQGKPQPTRRTPYVDINLTGKGGKVWRVLLARGGDFKRQAHDFLALLRGHAIPSEIAIREKPCGQTRRNGPSLNADRAPGGSQRQPTRLYLKFVGMFPRAEKATGDGCMLLETHAEAFLVATIDGRVERPWILNGDQITGQFCALARWRRKAPSGTNPAAIEAAFDAMKHWNPRHHAWLQRIGEDGKREKRWPKSQRLQFVDAYRKRCEKFSRRVKTWLQQMAAQVAGFCKRRGIGRVIYSDKVKTWLAPFPWHQLKTSLAAALDAAGVVFQSASDAASGEEVKQ